MWTQAPPLWLHAILALVQFLTMFLLDAFIKSNPVSLQVDLTIWAGELKTTLTSQVSVQILCIVFIGCSSFYHLYTVYYYESYKARIKHYANLSRWVEYSISASLMHVVIGIQVGYRDTWVLVFMFVLIQLCMLCGWLTEKDLDWGWFLLGTYCFIAVWIPLFLAFFLLVSSNTPAFVYCIVLGLFFLNSLFAVNAAILLYRGPTDRIRADWGYVCLSFFAKQLLVWLTYWGSNSKA
jgi:hypothetical protein